MLEAIVLSREDVREADQRISVLTREQGKQEFLARGIKKIISKNAAALEPTAVVFIGGAQGKTQHVLTSAQLITAWPILQHNLEKRLCAHYAMRTLDNLLHVGEPQPELFSMVHGWLESLEGSTRSLVAELDTFFFNLITLLGFMPASALAHEALHSYMQHCLERPVEDWKKLETLATVLVPYI